MDSKQKEELDKILINVGDLGFKRRVMEVVKGLGIKKGDKILDCGCGDGFYLMAIRNLFPKVKIVGVDYDERMLKIAREWQKQNKLTSFVRSDIYNLPFRNNFFDKIILSEVLEHLEDDLTGLEEVFRVLIPEGVLVITVPNHNYPFFWDPLNWAGERLGLGHFDKDKELLAGIWSMHLRLYYPEEITGLVQKAGFKILKVKALTHYCFPFNQIILHLGKKFYTKLPVSDSVVNVMEKFNWEKADACPKLNLIRGIQHILKKVDRLNEKRVISLRESSQSILVICRK